MQRLKNSLYKGQILLSTALYRANSPTPLSFQSYKQNFFFKRKLRFTAREREIIRAGSFKIHPNLDSNYIEINYMYWKFSTCGCSEKFLQGSDKNAFKYTSSKC